MSKKDTRQMNIFKKMWRLTGGGFISGFLIIVSLSCLTLLVAIGIWEVFGASSTGSTDGQDEQEQAQIVEAYDGEDKDGWLEGLDADDTSNIGNRINTSQLPDSSFIYEVSIEELANADSYLDGQTVQVTGESVGDRITSESNPKYCWITLQSLDSDDNEVSVYMSKSASRAIDVYGAYGKKGTSVQVRGIFYLASVDHQGASEIRAESVSVVSPGEILDSEGDMKSLRTGLSLIFIGCLLMLLFNVLRERQR